MSQTARQAQANSTSVMGLKAFLSLIKNSPGVVSGTFAAKCLGGNNKAPEKRPSLIDESIEESQKRAGVTEVVATAERLDGMLKTLKQINLENKTLLKEFQEKVSYMFSFYLAAKR